MGKRTAGLIACGGQDKWRLQKKHPTEIAQKMMDAIRSVSLGIMDYICNITLHIILMELLPKLKEEKNLKEHLFSDKGELNPVKTNSPPLKTWICISIFPWYVHIFFSSSSVAICLDCFPVALRVFPVNPAPLPLPQWCPTSAEPCA